MKNFKHSGAAGDLIYGLTIMKHLGGGNLYLHLNQMDWICQHYYGGTPDPFHRGKLTESDYFFMKDFLESQEYISSFNILDPQKTEISHNLDKFRPHFVGHKENYLDTYCTAFGIKDIETRNKIKTTPWLSVPSPTIIDGRTVIINRTERWLPHNLSPQWELWNSQNLPNKSLFVGLPHEYEKFKKDIGYDIPYIETRNMLELASIIAGGEVFIGNQSQCLALAVGLGKPFICEARTDLPKDRNDCYFENHPNGNYF